MKPVYKGVRLKEKAYEPTIKRPTNRDVSYLKGNKWILRESELKRKINKELLYNKNNGNL